MGDPFYCQLCKSWFTDLSDPHNCPFKRRCTKCKVFKLLDKFEKSPKNKSGYKLRCIECCEIAAKLSNKLTPELENVANTKAIKQLIKNHTSEYLTLLTQERSVLNRKK